MGKAWSRAERSTIKPSTGVFRYPTRGCGLKRRVPQRGARGISEEVTDSPIMQPGEGSPLDSRNFLEFELRALRVQSTKHVSGSKSIVRCANLAEATDLGEEHIDKRRRRDGRNLNTAQSLMRWSYSQLRSKIQHRRRTRHWRKLSANLPKASSQFDSLPRVNSADKIRRNYLARVGVAASKTSQGPVRLGGKLEKRNAIKHDLSGSFQSTEASTIAFTTKDIRNTYLRKLSYGRVWIPRVQQPPRHQTAIIFDWDDTLLCTSFLQAYGANAEDQFRPKLQRLEEAALKLLQTSCSLGQTFIVTNAMEGWVEQSAQLYLPELLPMILGLPVISARKYEVHHPGDPSMWKVRAFIEVEKQLRGGIPTNLIAVGDSQYEMDAVRALAQQFEYVSVKTVKFRPSPSLDELRDELKLIGKEITRIVELGRGIDVALEGVFRGGGRRGTYGKGRDCATVGSYYRHFNGGG